MRKPVAVETASLLLLTPIQGKDPCEAQNGTLHIMRIVCERNLGLWMFSRTATGIVVYVPGISPKK